MTGFHSAPRRSTNTPGIWATPSTSYVRWGFRKADAHGIHDLIGNAQEMTSGLFRPEIWQGKPGGVAVRGGSVSTPPADLRSSLRAELDVYAWNADEKKVEERRSFNSGARLAIGANVVVNTAQRAEIEKEYEAYKAELRRTMPVGRTLDNLVAQASVQLGSVDPILDRLMKENEALREPLKAVQATLDKARERSTWPSGKTPAVWRRMQPATASIFPPISPAWSGSPRR